MGRIRNCIIKIAAIALVFSMPSPTKTWGADSDVQELINDYPYYPRFFNETITKIYRAAEKGDFEAAAQVLLDSDNGTMAIDFMKSAFTNGNHQDDTLAKVEGFSERTKKNILSYISLQGQISDAQLIFVGAIKKNNLKNAATDLDRTMDSLKKLVELKKSLQDDTADATTLFNAMKATREVQDASYISYAIKFVEGTGRTENTGLLGVMGMQWNQIEKELTDCLLEKAASISQSIATALDQDDILKYGSKFKEIRDGIDALNTISPMLTRITDFGDTMGFKAGSKSHELVSQYKTSTAAVAQMAQRTEELINMATEISSQIHEVDDFIDKSVADTAQDLRDNLDNISQFYLQKSNRFADYVNRVDSLTHGTWISEFKKLKEKRPQLEKFINSYTAACGKISRTCSEKASDTTVQAGTRLISAGKQMYVEDTEKYQAIMSLIPDASNENAKQYPSKVLNSINTFRQSMELDVQALKKGAELLSTGSLSQVSNIQYMQKKIRESVDNIQKLSAHTDSLILQAKAQQKEALQAQSQIDVYYNRAMSAFSRGDFTEARNNLDRASSLYNSVIDSLKRDAEIQENTYDKIAQLKVAIITKQQPLLMQEIRKYKDSAKTAYYAGNFDDAYQQISIADETIRSWSVFMDMDVQTDEELETLKSRINTALEMKSGKELSPTDPLYPEMSQILSISNQYYQNGQKLISEGRTGEGKSMLNMAKNKLNELKIVYPRNQQANLLSMKIDQVLDLKQFNENFKTKIDELRNVNYSRNDSTAQEAYSDLQDLYALEPKYPGLSELIYQVELDLGLRKKVVDVMEIKPVETPQIAASEVVILSAADEAKYQQAINYLQNGNVIAAKSNLQELLAKPSNQRSAKIQKLQKRLTDMGY